MKYKVGDKVLLRNDLKDGGEYGDWNWIKGMLKGVVVTIIETLSCDTYFIEEDTYRRCYTDEMIVGLAKETKINDINKQQPKKIKTIQKRYAEDFETEVNELLNDNYVLMSTDCSNDRYKAILMTK